MLKRILRPLGFVPLLAIAVPLGIWSAYQAGRPPRRIPRAALPIAIGVLLLVSIVAGWTLAAAILLAIIVPAAVFHGLRGGPSGDTAVNLFAFVLLSVPMFLTALALAEYVADQHPRTPSRKVPMQFGARLVSGALCGAVPSRKATR